MSRRTDAELVHACRSGSQAAWDELVSRYTRLVYSIPRRYRLAEADAEDVHQDVFLALYRHLDALRDDDRLASWLITTAHRSSWRIGRQNPQTADDLAHRIEDVGQAAPDQARAWEEQDLVHRALATLGDPCESLLRALFLRAAEPDYVAIADELGMKIGSIGPTRARCFGKLAPLMEELGLGPDLD